MTLTDVHSTLLETENRLIRLVVEQSLLESKFKVGQTVTAKKDTNVGIGREAATVSIGTKAKITDEGEDDDGHFWFLSIKMTPGQYADNQEPWTMTKSVSDERLNADWK